MRASREIVSRGPGRAYSAGGYLLRTREIRRVRYSYESGKVLPDHCVLVVLSSEVERGFAVYVSDCEGSPSLNEKEDGFETVLLGGVVERGGALGISEEGVGFVREEELDCGEWGLVLYSLYERSAALVICLVGVRSVAET